MRNRTLLIFLLVSFIAIGNTMAAKEITADSKITAVTVYPQWARIIRTAVIETQPGVYTVNFRDLPLGADENSFRVSAHGVEGATLLGFNQSVESHLDNPRKEAADLEKLIQEIVRNRKKPLLDLSERLTQQKELLLAIGKLTSDGMSKEIKRGNVNADGWANAYDFFQSRMALLLDSIRTADNDLADLNDTLKLLGAELEKLRGGANRQTRSITVDLETSRPGEITLEIEYLIRGAFWSPLYDATYDPNTEKTELRYYANITQNTGEDWDDVALALSTAQPSQGVGPGEIDPWFLSALEFLNVRGGRAGEAGYIVSDAEMELDEFAPAMAKKEVPYLQAEVMTSGFDAAFKCPRRETVKAGGDPEKVSIGVFDFDTELSLIARPKLAEAVFRRVEITNNSGVPLLPGQVCVFSETGFLGHTAIGELIMPDNKLELAFGRDNNFKVTRKAIKSENSFKGDKRKREETIQIILKNLGTKARTVELEEPTPISQDNRIKVDVGKIEPKPDKSGVNGIEEWTFAIPANASDTVLIEYEVEYPSDLTVLNL